MTFGRPLTATPNQTLTVCACRRSFHRKVSMRSRMAAFISAQIHIRFATA